MIDNSLLIPEFPSSATLEDSGNGLYSPDWVKNLIIVEVNVQTASPDGTFNGMPFVLDHLAEMGVNGIWVTPIHGGRHYLNYGPASLNPQLVGTEDIDEGWRVVKNFVDEAHKRRIRVFFDIVTWGANPEAPIVAERPSFFDGFSEDFKGPLYNWKNPELVDWFSQAMVDIIYRTGADGFRADSSIKFCGQELYARVRRRLHDEGVYIAIFGEAISEGTETFFDFNEHSIDYWTTLEGTKFVEGDINFVSGYKADMIAAVKEGRGLDTRSRQAAGTAGMLRFYSSIVSCHDTPRYIACGNIVRIAYSSIFSPFIPVWYIGEEWNNPYTGTETCKWLYANKIDWNQIECNRGFYETVKKCIRIRRLFPEIFEYFPKNHRLVNFCAVDTEPDCKLPAYARTGNGYGILVIPNPLETPQNLTVTIPLKELGINPEEPYAAFDLLAGKQIPVNNMSEGRFQVLVNAGNVGVYGICYSQNNNNPFKKVLEIYSNV